MDDAVKCQLVAGCIWLEEAHQNCVPRCRV